jgi:hypothetical protein
MEIFLRNKTKDLLFLLNRNKVLEVYHIYIFHGYKESPTTKLVLVLFLELVIFPRFFCWLLRGHPSQLLGEATPKFYAGFKIRNKIYFFKGKVFLIN